MKKAFALLTAAAMVLSISSSSVQTVFAESSVPAGLPSFIESIGEITPVGEPQPIEDTALHAFSSDEGLSLEVVDSFPLTEEMIAEAESQFPPAETNEISPMANQPDLYPTAFSADTENYHEPFAADRPVVFTFYIYNTGDASASNVVVEYDVDGVIESGRRATLNTTIQAGYALKVEAQVICPDAGDYQIHLTVNPDHTISEERYDNNSVTSPQYTWTNASNSVDFAAILLEPEVYDGNELPLNTSVTYLFQVGNYGGKEVAAPFLITVNGVGMVSGNTMAIPGGTYQEYKFTVNFNRSANFDMGLHINANNSIAEYKTDNNEIVHTYTATNIWKYLFHGSDAQYRSGNKYYLYPATHYGLDIDVPYYEDTLEPVFNIKTYAPTTGIVQISGRISNYESCGNMVVIKTTNNPVNDAEELTIRLLHFKDNSLQVNTGDYVNTSTYLAVVGNTGASDYAHLHIDVNTANTYNGAAFSPSICIDPEEFFPEINFTHPSQIEPSPSPIASNNVEFDAENYFDLYLIQYVGTEEFYNWCNSVEDCGQYASITAFKDYFNISDEQFFDLCQQYGLTEIYKELL